MQNINYAFLLSRPVWGAWIEIILVCVAALLSGRAPYGARGLKLAAGDSHAAGSTGRAPYGARGLK